MKVGEQLVYLGQLKGLSKNEATKRIKEWYKSLKSKIGGVRRSKNFEGNATKNSIYRYCCT